MSPKAVSLDKEIAERVRQLREEREMSQPVVAGVLGVTYQSYQKIEAGKVSLRASTIAKLANLFGVPVEQLYGEVGDVMQNAPEVAHVIAIMQGVDRDAAQSILQHAIRAKGA